MAEKIKELEIKISVMESKESKLTEVCKSVEKDKSVSSKNEIIKHGKEKKSKLKERKDSVFKFGPEARKTVSDKYEPPKEKPSSKISKCNICDYSCEKLSTLKKHINSMHSKQECDICKKEFKTSMEVIIHKAKEHHEEEETWNVKAHSTPKKGNEDLSFIVRNAMLDDF